MSTSLKVLPLLACCAVAGCATTTVGPRGAREEWRVAPHPEGATVRTSFGATCRTPCMVRIPSEAFDITVDRAGYPPWTAHYDPAHPNEIVGLSPTWGRAVYATIWSTLIAAEVHQALNGADFVTPAVAGGAAFLVAFPWLLAYAPPHVRVLKVDLAKVQPDANARN